MLVLLGSVVVAVQVGPSGGQEAADRMRLAQLLERPPEDLAGVLEDAAAFTDPVLKQVAVQEWLHRNLERLEPAAASQACLSLGGVATDVCLRKVNSPHLRSGGN